MKPAQTMSLVDQIRQQQQTIDALVAALRGLIEVHTQGINSRNTAQRWEQSWVNARAALAAADKQD